MLFLSRKEGESFYMAISADADPDMKLRDLLSEPIRIEIDKISGETVRYPIDYPAPN